MRELRGLGHRRPGAVGRRDGRRRRALLLRRRERQVTIATQDGDLDRIDTVAAAEVAGGSRRRGSRRHHRRRGRRRGVRYVASRTGRRWSWCSRPVTPGSRPVETGTSTAAELPVDRRHEDGPVTYLAWYATTEGDLLVGGYGDVPGRAVRRTQPDADRPHQPAVPGYRMRPRPGRLRQVSRRASRSPRAIASGRGRRGIHDRFRQPRRGHAAQRRDLRRRGADGRHRLLGHLVTGPNQVEYDVRRARRGHLRVQLRGAPHDGRQRRGHRGRRRPGWRRRRPGWRRRQREPDRDRDGLGGSRSTPPRSTCRPTSRARSTSSTRTTPPSTTSRSTRAPTTSRTALFRRRPVTGPGRGIDYEVDPLEAGDVLLPMRRPPHDERYGERLLATGARPAGFPQVAALGWVA